MGVEKSGGMVLFLKIGGIFIRGIWYPSNLVRMKISYTPPFLKQPYLFYKHLPFQFSKDDNELNPSFFKTTLFILRTSSYLWKNLNAPFLEKLLKLKLPFIKSGAGTSTMIP